MNVIYNSTVGKNSSVVTVFAASSLTDSFTDIGDLFMSNNSGYDIVFNFAGTSTLNAQLLHGAKADVFAAASESQIKVAYDNDFINDYTIFAKNKLVLITPHGNNKIGKIEDMRDEGVSLVLSNEVVRWQRRLDSWISLSLDKPIKKLPPKVLSILRLAYYEYIMDDNIPVHAAVDSWVELSKKITNKKLSGLINAVLRKAHLINLSLIHI